MKAEAVASHQAAALPDEAGQVVQDLVGEYEAEDTVEAQLAHDADKIETLLQAREYQAQGQHHTEPWQESSMAALKTEPGRRLAEAIEATDPEAWWKAFAQSYRELRRTSRAGRDHQ